MSPEPPLRSAVVFGARNLGRAVIELLTAEGWAVVGVARSQATLDRVASTGGVALVGDITDAASAVVQVTGGSARRAMPGRGLWAAGSFGVRALTNAAALELKEHGIHVALLIVDAGIGPIDGATPGQSTDALADPRALAESIKFLAEQGARGATHELQITPLAERWVP
jgi:NADP-dependent 3-hydroxy acid dehydrogenase YdfG